MMCYTKWEAEVFQSAGICLADGKPELNLKGSCIIMAKYKIQRAKGVEGSTIYTYVAPGHNECVPTRLFDVEGGGANEIEGGKMIMGITYFVPGGGCDYGANPLESIYYILTGEMTLKTEDGETVLHAGDSFHCAGGVAKSVTNTGTEVTQMLVCLLPPQQ